jgi:hypothetical protein
MGQNGEVKRKPMEMNAKRREPTIKKLFSGVFKRALPTKGRMDNAEAPKTPIITPISASVDPNLKR